MTDDAAAPSGLDAAVEQLYGAPPEHFVGVRAELVGAARSAGDKILAKQIGEVRKPTTAAAVVNRQVLADPSVPDRLTGIGDRLRAAQGAADGIDRDVLRDLSVERRALVHELSTCAVESFAPTAGATVRDEVIATFDAAVADPDVAERLGRLTRAEHWSGFGPVADARALTIVQGGRSNASSAAGTGPTRPNPGARPPTHDAGRTKPAAARRERELSAAEATLCSAEHELSVALDDEGAARAHAAGLEKRITELQHELGAAEKGAQAARGAVRAARSRLRQARAARDRAARRHPS